MTELAAGRGPWRAFWRGLRPLLLGPLRFCWDTGFGRSALRCRAMDRRGRPIPWLTYPALACLDAPAFRGRRVLEFGGGASTLWWAARAAELVTVEEDPAWRDALTRGLARAPETVAPPAAAGPPRAPAKFQLLATVAQAAALPPAGFDVVIVDGGDRLAAARVALSATRSGGVILLDDSEKSWGGPGFPILALLRENGWRRLDFHGFAPGVARPRVTSLFFRPECELFLAPPPPRVPESDLRG